MSVRSFIRHSKEEVNSAAFELPSPESAPAIIKWGLCSWLLHPFEAGKKRKVSVTCLSCSNVNVWVDKWPIDTGKYKKHYWHSHESVMLGLKEEALGDIKAGEPFELTILNSSLFQNIDVMSATTTGSDASFETSSIETPSMKRPRRVLKFDEKKFRESILRLILNRNLPFSLVDWDDFHEVLKNTNINVPLISRHTLRNDLDKFYDDVVASLSSRFRQHEGRFAVTLDEWKSGNNYDFFGVTLHFYNDSFERENHTIGFEVLEEYHSYSGDVLYEVFVKILKTYGIEDRIISASRDNAAPITSLINMFSEADFAKANSLGFVGDIRCIGHVLNLATNAFLRYSFFKTSTSIQFGKSIDEMKIKHPTFEKIRKKMKALPKTLRSIISGTHNLKFMTHTFNGLAKKRKRANGSNKRPEVLKNDTETRWLSTLNMIKRFLYFQPEIIEVLEKANGKKGVDRVKLAAYEVSQDQWNVLKDIQKVLQTFEKPTIDLQGSNYITVSLVIPYIHVVVEELDNVLSRRDSNATKLEERNPYIARGVLEAKKKLLEYYPINKDSIRPLKTHYLATLLDPRFKLRFFEKMNYSEPFIDELKKYFREVHKQYRRVYDPKKTPARVVTEPMILVEPMSSDEEQSQQQESPSKPYNKIFDDNDNWTEEDDEVDRYLSRRTINSAASVTAYFVELRVAFPLIYRMAKDYLAIPAMSSPAEGLFSRMKDVITPKRNRLSPDSIKKVAISKSFVSGGYWASKKGAPANETDQADETNEENPTSRFLKIDDPYVSDTDDYEKLCDGIQGVTLSGNPFQD